MRKRWLAVVSLLLACGGGSSSTPEMLGSSAPIGPTGAGGSTGPTGATGATSPRLERLSASAECDGLVPASAPAPVDVSWTPPACGTCGGGISDGTGHVAVSARGGCDTRWQAFTETGAAANGFTADALVTEPSGWHGLSVRAVPGGTGVFHRAFSPDGSLLGEASAVTDPSLWILGPVALTQDPRGGCFTLTAETDASHNHWTGFEAQRFTPQGTPRWSTTLQFGGFSEHSVAFAGAGVSRQGSTLSLWQDSAYVDVYWHDGARAQIAAEQRAERYADVIGSDTYGPHAVELAPLLDGSVAVRGDGLFRRRYTVGATHTSALPAWLNARPDSTFRFTRGNLGYAVFPPAGRTSSDCSQAIELLAPSGLLCGRVTLPGTGSACLTGQVDQGWDGTVVQQLVDGACRYRFWPRLLAKGT